MRNALKAALKHSPLFLRKLGTFLYESTYRTYADFKERSAYPDLPQPKSTEGKKQNVLIYHISGMSFGGTEKNLQAVANMLADTHTVFFMHSKTALAQGRADTLDPRVMRVEFEYESKDGRHPYFIRGMKRHIKQVIKDKNIGLIISAGTGHAEYPLNTIRDIPIILINIFGSPALQKNVAHTIYISNEVRRRAEFYTGIRPGTVQYIPSQNPPAISKERVRELRSKLGIPRNAFVFGRIGRGEDSIFDPIAINAFRNVVQKHKNAHYVVMSPMPILREIVEKEQIPNVHFLPASGSEQDVWDFHHTIDCLAHFRYDGESCGLNIGESMMVGNPVISHISPIWNAQAEYLDDGFARIAHQDNSAQYAEFMEEFIWIRETNEARWNAMRAASNAAGQKHFSLESYKRTLLSDISNI